MENKNKTSENNEKLNLASDSDSDERALSDFRKRFQSVYSSIEPTIKNRILRYTVSFILIAIVVYFYIVFEGNRTEEIVRVFFFDMASYLLVPIALVLAFIAILYVSWDDRIFRRFRSPGLYMILLTGIFYILIFSGVDEYLFQISLAKWLTQATAVIIVALVKLFGMNIVGTTWSADDVITVIQFEGPNGLSSIGIDARCSGIHSLTIFVAIFLLMLFESRKRLKWNYKIPIIILIGIIGTYFVNLLRVTIIFIINYYQGWAVAEPIHNYLGYVFLMIWVPIFWLFILSWGEKKKEPETKDELTEAETVPSSDEKKQVKKHESINNKEKKIEPDETSNDD